jgi:uncharacterized membrane-anchored protein YitT (DUF2179 family)
MLRGIKPLYCLIAAVSSAVLAFGLYHVHSFSGVTEGGVLGMTLLLQHWLSLSPAVSGFVLNAACYALGWRVLGRKFVVYSVVSTASFSVAYAIIEQFPPLWPQLYDMPLLSAILGAVFVGIGCGFSVWVGGASGGDDALAMAVSHLLHWPIQRVYLITDLAVLGLSLSYIPLSRMWYSLLTVILSGQIVGWIQHIPLLGQQKEQAHGNNPRE